MRSLAQAVDLLSEEEITQIHQGALKIVEEVGMVVENEKMLERLGESGARVDRRTKRIFFSRKFVEDFLQGIRENKAVSNKEPREIKKAKAPASGYCLNYLNPETNRVEKNTLSSVIKLTILADYLENCNSIGMIGIPSDVPAPLLPLYGRYICWRYAEKTPSNAYCLWDLEVCPYILELCERVAAMEKRDINNIFRGSIFLISPLKLAEAEASQFVYFWERGYFVNISHMLSAGGTAPVTLSGTLTLALAEDIFISLILKTFFNYPKFKMGTTLAVLDMKTGVYPYGRPEQSLMEIAYSQLKRYYGAEGEGQAGRGSNAKGLDVELGLFTGSNAILNLLCVKNPTVHLGKISVDEIISPVLMVIHNEYLNYLNRLSQGFEVSAETIAFEVIKEVGPGGTFIDHPHTFQYFKKELWSSNLFSSYNLDAYLAGREKSLLDRAKEICFEVWQNYSPRGISEETEQEILKIIEKAKKKLTI
jgi:trimethylamine--corrinoid protein Co-methyltransferase